MDQPAPEEDLSEARAAWDALSREEQCEVYAEFSEMCIDSNRDAGDHWAYEVLMPMFMDGYVGH